MEPIEYFIILTHLALLIILLINLLMSLSSEGISNENNKSKEGNNGGNRNDKNSGDKKINILPDLSGINVRVVSNHHHHNSHINVSSVRIKPEARNFSLDRDNEKYTPKEKILIKRKEYRDYLYNSNRRGNDNNGVLIPRTQTRLDREVYYEVEKSFQK